MQIAGFVFGLILSLIVFGGSFFSACASIIGEAIEADTAEVESLSAASGGAFIFAILGIIGSSLIFNHKKASMIILLITAGGLILVGVSTIYKDMAIFGGLYLIPVIFAGLSKTKTKV